MGVKMGTYTIKFCSLWHVSKRKTCTTNLLLLYTCQNGYVYNLIRYSLIRVKKGHVYNFNFSESHFSKWTGYILFVLFDTYRHIQCHMKFHTVQEVSVWTRVRWNFVQMAIRQEDTCEMRFVQVAACVYGHVWGEYLYITPRVYTDMCQTEKFLYRTLEYGNVSDENLYSVPLFHTHDHKRIFSEHNLQKWTREKRTCVEGLASRRGYVSDEKWYRIPSTKLGWCEVKPL